MENNCSANIDSMTVEQAARYIGCSTRRIRALLSQNRLAGHKDGVRWVVHWPLRYTLAKRGPLLKVNRQYGYQRPALTLPVGNGFTER